MIIKSAQSNLSQAKYAVQQVSLELEGVSPSLLLVAASPASHFQECLELLTPKYPQTHVIGSSSFGATMAQSGFCQSETGVSLGVWGIDDVKGNYGAALGFFDDDLDYEVNRVLEQALESAGRAGELPELLLFHSTIGHEEKVLRILGRILGDSVPVVGGGASSCLPESEPPRVGCDLQTSSEGFVLAALFPSGKVGCSFISGCSMVRPIGVATRVTDHQLVEIDHQPALIKYQQALGKDLQQSIDDEQWYNLAIGRLTGEEHGLPMFAISIPRGAKQTQIDLNSPAREGERLFLMEATAEGVKQKSKRVLDAAMEQLPEGRLGGSPEGALIFYCSGLMQLLSGALERESELITQTLGGQADYLTLFTEGEQGPLLHSTNVHGNMMLSSVVFYGGECERL